MRNRTTREAEPVGLPAPPGERVAPSWTDPVPAVASRLVGGPLGRHALLGRQWFWTPLRVVLLLATITLAVGWLVKTPCLQTTWDSAGIPRVDWRDGHQYQAMCYSDTVPLYTAQGLDRPGLAGLPSEQDPVLTGVYHWIVAKLAQAWVVVGNSGWLPSAAPAIVFFNISAVGLTAAWLVTVWALVKLSPRRPWDAALAALSPLVVVHAFTNVDVLSTALATTGLLAWSRRRPALAGVLLGLGAATAVYPLLLLFPILLLGLRTGRPRAALRTSAAAALAWAVVNLPVVVLSPFGWAEFFRVSYRREAGPDTLYTVLSVFTGWSGIGAVSRAGQTPVTLNLLSATLFGLACAAIGALAWLAPRPPRLASLCFLVACAFLLCNKVWNPQNSLWLVPLAVWAIPQWKPVLAWMTVDALVWAPRMAYYLGPERQGLPIQPFLGAVLLRDAALLFLAALVLRTLWRPQLLAP